MASCFKKVRSRNYDRCRLCRWPSTSPAQAESVLEQAAGGTDIYVNANKIEYICFKEKGAISTLTGNPLKLVDQFTYLARNISSTESDVNVRLVKAWNVVEMLSII